MKSQQTTSLQKQTPINTCDSSSDRQKVAFTDGKSILKKINSKWFLLFLFTFFSITTQAQYSEDEFLNDWITEALNDDDNSRIESDGFGGWNDVDVDDDDLDLIVTEMDNDQYNEWLASGGWEDKADHSKEDMENKENQTDHHYVESWEFNEKDPTFDEMYGDLFNVYEPYEAPEPDDDQYPDDDNDTSSNNDTTTEPDNPKPDDCPTVKCPSYYRV